MKKKILSLLSGGTDSFVLVDFLLRHDMNVFCLFVDYGQLSAKFEYESFLKICEFENIKRYHKIEIKNFGENIETGLSKMEINEDFFPSRNLLLLTIASSLLWQFDYDYISIGVIKSLRDYPDCMRYYFNSLEPIINESIKREIKILTPIDEFTKLDIIKYLMKYKLPIENSYSCQKGVANHCKKCPSCIERFEAIEQFKKIQNKL